MSEFSDPFLVIPAQVGIQSVCIGGIGLACAAHANLGMARKGRPADYFPGVGRSHGLKAPSEHS